MRLATCEADEIIFVGAERAEGVYRTSYSDMKDLIRDGEAGLLAQIRDEAQDASPVIGTTAKGVKKADALNYVFGYTVINDVNIRSCVNGELRQDASTALMLFDVPTLIEAVSAYITLEPGDVLSTGTPAGVGKFRNPPVYLLPGDRVVVEVEGIGQLENGVAAGW